MSITRTDLLVAKCGEILEVDEAAVPVALTHLAEEKMIFTEQLRTLNFGPRTSPEAAVYLARFYVSENRMNKLKMFSHPVRKLSMSMSR